MATIKKNNDTSKKKTAKTKKKDDNPILKKPRALTEKQEAFCHFYLDCKGNASRAFRMAYDTSNQSDETVWNNAYKLKNNTDVMARIDEIREERRRRSEIKRERAEKKLWNIINANPENLLLEDPLTGKMRKRTPFQIDAETLDAIDTMDVDGGKFRYKFLNANEALRTLGKWNGWEKTDINLNHHLNEFGEILIGDDIAD